MLTDEQLKGKYITYVPEITEEIFDKILSRLRSAGFESFGAACNFNGFKKYKILILYTDSTFQTATVSSGNEISYKDIIGEEEWWKDLKEGDYFVVTKSCKGYNGQLNCIYKANADGYYYSKEDFSIPYETGLSSTIGLRHIDIRPATPDEIKMYEHAGKPVDVTTYKIPEMVIGNYYRVEEEDFYMIGICESVGDSIYSKATYISLDNELPYGDGFRKSARWCYSDIGRTFKEATPEEKQWLNVCIQENKFIEKDYVLRGYDMWGKSLQLKPTFKSRVNFKIGDKVEAICNPTPFREVEHTNWNPLSKKGEIVTVKALSTKHPDLFQVEEWEHWFMEDQFKLVEKVKPVFQVHDKCNIGDIIVSLEPQSRTVTSRRNGDLLRVLEKSIKEELYYGDSFSILQENSNTYRLATPQEIQLFNQGIKNIYETMEYKVGDWVVVLDTERIRGWNKQAIGHTFQIRNDGGYFESFIKGGSEAIDPENKYSVNYILKDVRKATPEEIAKATGSVELVVGNWYELHSGGYRWIFKFLKFGNSDEIWSSISATPHDNYTDKFESYLTGKLENCKPADMEEVYRLFPEEKPKEEPKEITSYGGLKIGDVLPEKVICDWGKKDYNWICLSDNSPTWKKLGGFIKDRYIESFKDIDGHISFLVSGTNEVYMKASGFKAFMEGYSNTAEPKKSSEFPLITSSKVKIGDRVRIISIGNRYTSFNRAFKAIGFKNTVENIAGNNGDEGTVFYITKHPSERDKTLIAINLDNGKQCLINEIGIEVINDSKKAAVFDPVEWGWVIPNSVHLEDLRDCTNPLTPDECIKQDVISPILFNVKEI